MNIGICGGTFDPFHRGHLEPVLAVREEMEWDRVIYVVAHRQPFKTHNETSADWHRYAMTVLATLEYETIVASDIEIMRGDVSYTVDMLEEIRTQYKNDTIDWIIGDDHLAELHRWKNIDRIFELANFAVLSRGGQAPPRVLADRIAKPNERATHGTAVILHNPLVPISSTNLRNLVRAGESIDAFVDPRVSRYIDQYGLYKGPHE